MSDLDHDNRYAAPLAAVADIPAASGPAKARRLSRLWANLIDGFASLVIYFPGLFILRSVFGVTNVYVVVAVTAPVVLVFQGWLIYQSGQTIGKRAVGIRIVRSDGQRATFQRAFLVRMCVPAAVGLVPILGGIAVLIDTLCIFRDSRRCLHDEIADTIVVEAAGSERATLAGSLAAPAAAI